MCRKRWFQFNSRIIRTHFSSRMTLNIWKLIAETLSRRHVWLSSLICRFVTLSYDVSERKWFSARCYCDAIYRRVILFVCGRWRAVDIYLDASRLGIYPPLFTSPSGDSCILFAVWTIFRHIYLCHERTMRTISLRFCFTLCYLMLTRESNCAISLRFHSVFSLTDVHRISAA